MRSRWLIVAAVVAIATAGCTTLVEVSAPNGPNHAGYSVPAVDGGGPVLSGDGRYSVFTAPRTPRTLTPEAFRRDAATGRTVRVSSDANGDAVGGDVPAISRDGTLVVFRTTAALVPGDHNLDPARGLTGADWYLKDMTTGTFDLLTVDEHGDQLAPGGPDHLTGTAYVSASGRYVAFQMLHAASSIFESDIYLRDRETGVTHRIDGGYRNLAGLSGDGLHVGIDDLDPCTGFCPPPYPGVHIDDWSAGTKYTIGCGAGGRVAMSDAGIFVAVAQVNEVEGCALGLARYNRLASTNPTMFTTDIPATQGGGQPQLGGTTMSADGTRAAFTIDRDLTPVDTNRQIDVYVSDLTQRSFAVASVTPLGTPSNGPSTHPWLSADGSTVQFDTEATNLVPADADGMSDTVVAPAVRPVIVDDTGDPIRVPRAGGVSTVLGTTGVARNAIAVVSGEGVTADFRPAGWGGGFLTLTAVGDAVPGPRTLIILNRGPFGIAAGYCIDCVVVAGPS